MPASHDGTLLQLQGAPARRATRPQQGVPLLDDEVLSPSPSALGRPLTPPTIAAIHAAQNSPSPLPPSLTGAFARPRGAATTRPDTTGALPPAKWNAASPTTTHAGAALGRAPPIPSPLMAATSSTRSYADAAAATGTPRGAAGPVPPGVFVALREHAMAAAIEAVREEGSAALGNRAATPSSALADLNIDGEEYDEDVDHGIDLLIEAAHVWLVFLMLCPTYD